MERDQKIDAAVAAFDRLKLHEMKVRRKYEPAFIGIGPGRAGSTSLYKLLDQHPRVFLPVVKEINFFGFRSQGNGARPWGMTYQEYKTYFTGATPESVCGEISPSYFILPEALREIRSLLPNCKIVCGLRNPLERLISHFKYHQENHGFASLDAFLNAAKAEAGNMYAPKLLFHWFHPARLVASSLYSRTLKLCRDLFAPERVHVYLFEDFVQGPETGIGIQKFLGLEPIEAEVEKINASRVAKDPYLIAPENWRWMESLFRTDLVATEQILGRSLPTYLDIQRTADRVGIKLNQP